MLVQMRYPHIFKREQFIKRIYYFIILFISGFIKNNISTFIDNKTEIAPFTFNILDSVKFKALGIAAYCNFTVRSIKCCYRRDYSLGRKYAVCRNFSAIFCGIIIDYSISGLYCFRVSILRNRFIIRICTTN